MADTAITVTTLTANTLSADLIVTAEGGTTVSAGNTAVVTHNGETRNLILSFYAASAATVTVSAGDNPPGQRAGLGATSALSVPAGDVVLLVVEGARFSQDNATLRIVVATNDVVVGAHRIPDSI